MNIDEQRASNGGKEAFMGKTRRYGLVPVALILFATLLCSSRPLKRAADGAHCRWGVNQFIVAAEPGGDFEAPLTPPLPSGVPVSVLAVTGTVLLILKVRRSGYVAVPVRRLRLPFRKSSRRLLPD